MQASCHQRYADRPAYLFRMAPASVEAVTSGDSERLKQAVADDPAAASARDDSGLSVLLLALYRRRFDLAEIILTADPPLDVFELAALGRSTRLATALAA